MAVQGMVFTAVMVAHGQPMATMQQIGQVLADGLSQPVGELVVGSAKTAAEVKSLIQTAVAAVGEMQISAITESIETLADREILWLDLALSAPTTLADYSLSLGQSPSSDAGTPSLLDQGLKTGDIAIDVVAGVHGNIHTGVDLRPGLPVDQAIVSKVENWRPAPRPTRWCKTSPWAEASSTWARKTRASSSRPAC